MRGRVRRVAGHRWPGRSIATLGAVLAPLLNSAASIAAGDCVTGSAGRVQVRQAVAEAQAEALGKAFESADIDIIGGDGQFFDRIMNAVSYGKAVDGFVQGSDAAQGMLSEYAKGHRSLPADLKDVLTRPALGSGDIQNLTISALLAKLMAGADAEKKGKLDKLIESARELGL